MTRHRGPGFRRGRARVRHQGVGRARPRARRDRDGAPRDRGRGVHHEPRAGRAGAGLAAPSRATGAPRRSCSAPGNANAATGERGPARRAAHVRAHRRQASASRPTDVLVCSTGLIGIPMPMDALEAGIPKLCGELAADGGRRGGAGDPHHRHGAQGSGAPRAGAATVGGMAKGAAMLSPAMATMLAVVTTDAAIDAAALQRGARRARSARRSTASRVDGCRSTNDTVLVLANGRAGAVDAAPRSPTRSPRCAARSPSRWHATPKARRSSCGSRSSAPAREAEARIAARAVANSQLVQCSLNGSDPYWGRVLSELGASGAFLDPERVDISYNGVTVCRDGVACAHDAAALAAAHGRARHRDPVRPAPRARRGDGAHHRPLARVHRREPADVVTEVTDVSPSNAASRMTDAGDKAAHPRRGAAVHPRVLGQDRRDQVRRPRDGERGARGAVRDRRRAHAARRHESRRRARRRTADHRAHAPARQGARVRRRAARHRRRDRRHRAHGARRQGEPRDRRDRSTGTARTRSGCRARTPG